MTAEQLEAARSERMRHNGHAATQYEDVRTWIEETGLCLFLPRSVQAGFTAPTFVEAIAGRRVTETNLDLVSTADHLLVRLEAEGVAVRLSLNGQPGDQPDYVVASWALPYVYALRGDRDWRRPPQLTGSRQVSQLAVQVAKQLETGNQSAPQLRDALGREVTESATLRALHELWRQLRVIPVVPEPGKPALWQPLRQRFQKAIAEGASTSQVTAISVLASIYLQAVIAASMEDVEMFLAALTARSKIREVVRGLAATRQVHTTTLGQVPLYYVAGTLPEFPAEPSFSINGSSYLNRYQRFTEERDWSPSESVSLAAFADRQRTAHSHSPQPDAQTAPQQTQTEQRQTEQRQTAPRRSARPAARALVSGPNRGDRARSEAHSRNSGKASGPARKTSERRNEHGTERRNPSARPKRVFRADPATPAHASAHPATAAKPTARPAAKSPSRLNGSRPVAKPMAAARPSERHPAARPSSARPSSARPSSARPSTRRSESAPRSSASKRYSMAGASARQPSVARSAARPASSRPKAAKPVARNRAR